MEITCVHTWIKHLSAFQQNLFKMLSHVHMASLYNHCQNDVGVNTGELNMYRPYDPAICTGKTHPYSRRLFTKFLKVALFITGKNVNSQLHISCRKDKLQDSTKDRYQEVFLTQL